MLPRATSVIVNLRRTNLVALAYSKLHHSGCGAAGSDLAHGRFDLDMLLQCAWHYAVGDQEFSSHSALAAADASGAELHLFLYEDVLADPQRMQRQIATSILGHEPAGFVVSAQSRLHKSPLCDYPDVHCTGGNHTVPVLTGLLSSRHPCLVRQWRAANTVAFTMPRSANGTIDLEGDCDPLPTMIERDGARALAELYRAPSSGSPLQAPPETGGPPRASSPCDSNRSRAVGDGLRDRALLLERDRLLLCRIEKNGFMALTHVAHLLDPSLGLFKSAGQERRPRSCSATPSGEALQSRLRSTDWQSVVVYRDPAERFLSAYKSKCLLADGDGRTHCQHLFNLSDHQISLEAVARALPASGHLNPHWIPQSRFCGGSVGANWSSYTHAISNHNLTAGLLEVVDHVTARKAAAARDRARGQVRAWLESQATGTAHSTHAAAAMSELHERPEVMARLRNFYREDYALFGAHHIRFPYL